MNTLYSIFFILIAGYIYGQGTSSIVTENVSGNYINDSIPELIPKKWNGKYGYINKKGEVKIASEYSNVGFFAEDCNLLNSPDEKLRNFGSEKYASATIGNLDYRINQKGKKVYQFKQKDLGTCENTFKKQLYSAYIMQGFYGLIDNETFKNYTDYKQFTIYPQYQYLYILQGKDLTNPMMIAVHNNYFGIVDSKNNVIIPFIYSDIKKNYSWKLANMFEVTKDGTNYFLIDVHNKSY